MQPGLCQVGPLKIVTAATLLKWSQARTTQEKRAARQHARDLYSRLIEQWPADRAPIQDIRVVRLAAITGL